MHAARLARELEMPRVLVPRNPGILCALGLLMADLKTNYAQTRLLQLESAALSGMAEVFATLEARALAWFESEGILPTARTLRRTVDLRYAGQNYELPVNYPETLSGEALLRALQDGFETAHRQMYGYCAADEPIQIVTLRIEATGTVRPAQIKTHAAATTDVRASIDAHRDVWLPEAGGSVRTPVYDRDRLGPGHAIAGPAIVEQMDATTVVLPGQTATVDPYLNLLLADS